MKKLIVSISLILLSISARAQSTNISVRTTVVDGTGTNQLTIQLPPRYVQGMILAWSRDVMVANQLTNTPPSFFSSVTNEVTARLKSLQDQAIADELATNKITTAAILLPSLWPTMSTADQINIAAIFRKYVP